MTITMETKAANFLFIASPASLSRGSVSKKFPQMQSCYTVSCLTEWVYLPGTAGMMMLGGSTYLRHVWASDLTIYSSNKHANLNCAKESKKLSIERTRLGS